MGEEQPQQRKGGAFAAIMALVARVTAWALALKPVRAMLRYFEHHGPMLADSITYRTLFSVFAGVFLGFAIAGVWLAGRPEAIKALIETIDAVIPGLIGEDGLIHPDDLVQPLTLSIAGVLALIGLVGAAIGAIGSLRLSFRNLGDLPDDQTFFIWVIARDFVLAIGFGALLAATAALTFFGTAAVDVVFGWFGVSTRDPAYDGTIRVLSIVVIFVIDTVVVAAMFRILSGLRPSARSLWSGAVIGGIGLTGLQELSGLFVAGATANPLLASFGSLIALLLWFNLSAQVILIAATYIVIGVEDEHDRVGARYGATTFAMRRMQRAERRASIAATELADARAAVERERETSAGGGA